MRTREILDGGRLVGAYYSLSDNGKGCPQKKYLIWTKYEFVELLQLHCQPEEKFCWICFNLINILISFIGLASRTILILLICNNHWWICVTINSLWTWSRTQERGWVVRILLSNIFLHQRLHWTLYVKSDVQFHWNNLNQV